ncbi:hypothetical protein BOO86_27840 [Mycobacterium sp. CBMA 234]|uniref:hypothetical protein n=1 Tax=Mycolicibacterium sp. CBMA 234 TaxID=1918495 RepID=UPI0012DC8817|nr:hypothetical protein [Mycolicibacterium sp. CBMA 234]MUL68311.1 hypothetical protein [Mycolicibacterium sp. CBMA 234]
MATIRNPLGLGVAIAGAGLMALSAFLPVFEPKGFRHIVDNTMAQQGYWPVLVLAFAIGVTAYLAVATEEAWWKNPTYLAVVSVVYLIQVATDKNGRTMYPVNLDGTVDYKAPGQVVDLGIAVYVYGLGVAVAFVGSLLIWKTVNGNKAKAIAPIPKLKDP